MPTSMNANALGIPVAHTYVHHQNIPEAVWNITHDLCGKYPAVTVVDSAGSVVVGDVKYGDMYKVTVTFSSAFSGIAYLN